MLTFINLYLTETEVRGMQKKGLIPLDVDIPNLKTFLNFPKIKERLDYFQKNNVGRNDEILENRIGVSYRKYYPENKGVEFTIANNTLLHEQRYFNL